MLFVHAHPDDETIGSGATMAKYVSEGAQVTLVTCTLGEYGDVVHPELEHVKGAENLGSHRLAELTEAMAALGVTDFVRLGGDGTYHDSGMVEPEPFRILPEPDRAANAFWDADLLEASLHLVAILRDRRPHVLISYTPFGGYGHPDHIQAHRVATYAAVLAGVEHYRTDLGPAWHVPRVLWSTSCAEDWALLIDAAKAAGRSRPTARVLSLRCSPAVATSAPTFRAVPGGPSRPRPCERTSPRSISPIRCGR